MGFPSSAVPKTSILIFTGDNNSALHPLFNHFAKPTTDYFATRLPKRRIAVTPYAPTLTSRRASCHSANSSSNVTNLVRPSLPRRPLLNGTRGHTFHRRLVVQRPICDGTSTGFFPPGDEPQSTATRGNLLRSFNLLEDQENLQEAPPITTIMQSGVEPANVNQHRRRWRGTIILNLAPPTTKASSS